MPMLTCKKGGPCHEPAGCLSARLWEMVNVAIQEAPLVTWRGGRETDLGRKHSPRLRAMPWA